MSSGKFNPWPWGIVAAFAIFVPATAGLIIMACRHPEQLVRADYYEQEIRHQARMESRTRALRLGLTNVVVYDASQQCIRLTLPTEHARTKPQGRIELYRAAEAGLDRHEPLALDPAGIQRVDARQMKPGPWQVRVNWIFGTEEFAVEQRVEIRPPGA